MRVTHHLQPMDCVFVGAGLMDGPFMEVQHDRTIVRSGVFVSDDEERTLIVDVLCRGRRSFMDRLRVAWRVLRKPPVVLAAGPALSFPYETPKEPAP